MLMVKKFACSFMVFVAMAAASAFAAGTLPAGYTEVQYVGSSGSQNLNTGIAPKTTTRVVCDFQYTVVDGSAQCGWGSTGNKESFFFGVAGDGTFKASVSGNFTVSPTGVAADTDRHTFDISMSALKLDGTAFANATTSPFSNAASGNTLYLFALHAGWSPNVVNYASMRIYSCKIYDGETLVRDFVPVVRASDSKAGLYDLETDAFFGNGGTGDFSAGPEVLPSDDALGVSGFPGLYGSPTPAYGIHTGLSAGDTVAVSCASYTNTTLMIEYICTGWKLFNGAGTEVSNGTETAFTYTHPTPAAARRLVWQWKTRPVGADATDLLPTLCMTFNGQSLANTGTGTLTMKDKGTPTYVPSADGYALNASVYTPWGDNVSNVITANRDSSIAVVAALGTTSCGILVCFRNSSNNAGIILRRGTTANQVVLTQGNSTTALITVNDIENADTDYHLYVMNILSSGVELYVDGELVGTTTSTPRANAMNSMQIGSRHGNVISPEAIYGGGLIDDLRVYASALDTEQMKALGESIGVISPLSILQIPVQFCLRGETPEPGFTVTNTETGASWDYGEGGVASGQTPFDVAYSFTNGYGTVTLTGKAGSEYEGKTVKRNYKLTHDLIVNGDFESGAWAPGWTASGTYAVIGTSSSAYQPNASTTFISGAYCAILQKQNVASQVFTNDSQYCAELSWKCKQRGGYSDIPYEVMLDGERIFYEYFPTGTSEVHYRTVENIVLQPGEHTLTFHTITTADRTLFLDNVSLEVVSKTYLEILPIPNQSCATGPCRPEFVVSNLVEGQSWRIGGDIVSSDFDVAYSNNDVFGTATVTATGKGDYEGDVLSRTFAITEDENVSTTAASSYRLLVGDNLVYVFTNAASAQTITARKNLFLADALLVGGGGAGGINFGGGGGGGGVVALDGVNFSLAPGESLEFSVGAGGKPSTSTAAGNSRYGGNSSISIGDRFYFAKGGGGGGNVNQTAGLSGGSGGGGAKGANGGAGTAGQGYAGAKAGSNSRSGGGGGAGHAGYEYTTEGGNRAGNGGEGVTNDITGVWVYYGGGGGGGGSANGNDLFDPGYGGLGGGGNGGKGLVGDDGVDGLGGGGGGGGYNGDRLGGNGGSGTVILAFKPSDFNIDTIPPQTLVAGVARPEPVVRLYGSSAVLTKDVDYTVSYTDNDALGTALMTVTGIGTYAGKVGYAKFLVVERYYAKPAVDVEGDGLSWATAMSAANFFATHGVVDSPCEVWIAAGTVSAQAFSITNNAQLVIRGGFAGTETSLDERAEGALTVFDGENTAKCLLKALTGENAELTLDQIKFYRAKENGFIKTGTGSLRVVDCVIEGNGKDADKIFGRGMNVSGGGVGSLVVSNCVFKGNVRRGGIYTYGGFGIYVSSFSAALVDDSLFVTNGYSLGTIDPSGNCGADGGYGSAMRVIDTPVTVRRCRFAGNVTPLWKSSDSGGVLMLNGACGGSLIDHCVFVGNTDRASQQGASDINTGGALAVRLSSAAGKVKVQNCTFAYNIAHGHCSAGGISVSVGDVDIDNSIFWKNTRARVTTVGYGSDVQVSSGSKASIRNSLVTTLDGTALAGAGLTVDEASVFAADPKLVTTTADFTNLLRVTSSAIFYNPSKSGIYESLAAMDVHLKSPAGYVVNGGAAGPATTDYSPAIDLGDPAADYSNEPAPNGGRLNLGVFGNTAEASRTATGQPEANVEVTFPDGMTRPKVTITMGLESGAAYSATVQLHCTTGGVLLSSQIWRNVGNGEVLEFALPYYLTNGDNFNVLVTINAPSATQVEYQKSETVEGSYPPFYGKGGGPNVIHVREGADCLMNGTSWTDAYPSLDAAFASTPDASKTEMWLAVTNDYMSLQATLSSSLTIRGGFAGVENSADERAEGDMTWLDGGNIYRTMNFSVGSGATLTIERIRFSHSVNSELNKTGAGNLTVRDCWFTDSIQSGTFSGRGISASGGTVTIANCRFTKLIGPKDLGTNNGGDGIYLNSCTAAYVDNCLFATNGLPEFGMSKGWQARHKASGAWINATPTIFRNCRFAANMAAMHESSGYSGTVYFSGASGGSKMVNCALVGNSDTQGSDSTVDIVDAGTIVCAMSAADQTLDIENCTIAYNLTQGQKTAAGITIIKGTANVKNSIIYGNVRGLTNIAEIAGADIEVKANGTLNLSYSLVTGLTSNYVNAVSGGTTNIGAGVISGVDPLFATTTNAFRNLLAYGKNNKTSDHCYLPNSARGTCAEIDVHPRTRTGYLNKDGVLIRDPERVESPTIDKGDPDSDYSLEPEIPGAGGNGHRVNLGAYGNTPEAALTKPKGFFLLLR